MAAIKLARFAGEQPRIVPRLLPPTGAQRAINARLDNGALTPYRGSSSISSIEGSGPFATILFYNDEWLAFSSLVHAATGPVATDRLYYTGDGAPKLRVGDDIYDLALSAPTASPTATLGGSGSGDVITRSYVYTFVTAYGEESEPSPPSNDVAWQSGRTTTLSAIQAHPSGRNITKQRFYRTQTGSVGTDYYFIAERNSSNSDFSDTVASNAFGEPLPSRNYNPPPSTLAGLIALPNGMMAAFSGKDLYFCEPYQPHAWPETYVLTTDVPIVALACAGTTVWVLTEGVPYRVSGTTPASMVMEKVKANLPCVNARGVVDLGYAVAWPSNDGLAVARADGAVGLATGNLFAPREWRKLNPGTMRAGQVAGRWIGSYDAADEDGLSISGSLIIDLSGDSYLIRSGVSAAAWFYEIASGLSYFLDAPTATVRLFDAASAAPELLYWRSKPFVLPHPDTMGCILVESGDAVTPEQITTRLAEIAAAIAANEATMALGLGIGGELAGAPIGVTPVAGDLLVPVPTALGGTSTISVYADSRLVATVGTLNRPARLPSGFTARQWEIAVFSDIEITQVTMTRTMDELKQAAAGP